MSGGSSNQEGNVRWQQSLRKKCQVAAVIQKEMSGGSSNQGMNLYTFYDIANLYSQRFSERNVRWQQSLRRKCQVAAVIKKEMSGAA
uniref:Uncharacterized protein n=1 Tax=Acrobeloides nanus TaxID=290746 RepID=A0A914EM82_9BILA